MPIVRGKHYPYTKKGKEVAKKAMMVGGKMMSEEEMRKMMKNKMRMKKK